MIGRWRPGLGPSRGGLACTRVQRTEPWHWPSPLASALFWTSVLTSGLVAESLQICHLSTMQPTWQWGTDDDEDNSQPFGGCHRGGRSSLDLGSRFEHYTLWSATLYSGMTVIALTQAMACSFVGLCRHNWSTAICLAATATQKLLRFGFLASWFPVNKGMPPQWAGPPPTYCLCFGSLAGNLAKPLTLLWQTRGSVLGFLWLVRCPRPDMCVATLLPCASCYLCWCRNRPSKTGWIFGDNKSIAFDVVVTNVQERVSMFLGFVRLGRCPRPDMRVARQWPCANYYLCWCRNGPSLNVCIFRDDNCAAFDIVVHDKLTGFCYASRLCFETGQVRVPIHGIDQWHVDTSIFVTTDLQPVVGSLPTMKAMHLLSQARGLCCQSDQVFWAVPASSMAFFMC